MDDFKDLTETQREVYDLRINIGLSISDIAKRRGVSYNAIRKICRQIANKGYSMRKLPEGSKKAMPIIMPMGSNRYFRVHNLHIIIEPYYFYPRYEQVERGFGIPFNKWTVTFNKRNIELQLKRKESFDDEEMEKALQAANDNIQDTIFKLQDKYGFEAFKQGKVNIRLVNHHIAEVNNGIAKDYKGQKIGIDGNDNKIWLFIDKSLSMPELETVHPDQATDDMRLLKDYLNDLRDNKPPTNSQLLGLLTEVAKNQAIYNQNIKLHLEVLNEMKDALKAIKKEKGQHGGLGSRSGQTKPSPLFPSCSPPSSIRDILPEGWFE